MKTKHTADHPVAIPTTFKGIEFKSRLEAQTAFLFETFGIPWQYEPKSLMLPNGVCYTPDFWLPGQLSVVECRGYDTAKGEKQLVGFVALLRGAGIKFGAGRRVQTFFVITSNGSTNVYHNWQEEDERTEGVLLSKCCVCKHWSIGGFDESGCRQKSCDSSPNALIQTLALTTDSGKVLLNGQPSEGWLP